MLMCYVHHCNQYYSIYTNIKSLIVKETNAIDIFVLKKHEQKQYKRISSNTNQANDLQTVNLVGNNVLKIVAKPELAEQSFAKQCFDENEQ